MLKPLDKLARSPSAEERKKPIIPKDTFLSASLNKRQLPGGNMVNMLRSPILDAYTTSTFKPKGETTNITNNTLHIKPQKIEINKPFLQTNLNTNLNHIAHSSSNQVLKKNIGEGLSLSSFVKKVVNNNSPQKVLENSSPKSPFVGVAQSPHSTKVTAYRDMKQKRASRFSVGISPFADMKASTPEQQQPQTGNKEDKHMMQSIPEERKSQEPKLVKNRAKSLQALKSIQKAEDGMSSLNFTSLKET